MYYIETQTVNGLIIGRGNRWAAYISTTTDLRQIGEIYPSRDAAFAAVRGRQ